MSPQVISATEAKNNFSQLLSLVAFHQEEFLIQRQGKPIALLSPQPSRPKVAQPHHIINQFKKYPLGLKSWEQAKPLLEDLHLPQI